MLLPFGGRTPILGPRAWIAEGAQVIGDVTLGADVSIWFNCVLRGDVGPIRIGAGSNIQDLSMIHITSGQGPCVVGERVTVGHHVVLHGCTVGDGALIGMGAIVLDGAEIGSEAMIGAGSLVTPRTHIPPRVLALGSPCKVVRPLRDSELVSQRESARHYIETAASYREGR